MIGPTMVLTSLKSNPEDLAAFGSGYSVIPDDVSSMCLEGGQADRGELRLLLYASAEHPFDRVAQVVVDVGITAESNVRGLVRTDRDISPGDVVLIRFWMRCLHSMTGEGSVSVVLEGETSGSAPKLETRFSAGCDWAEYFVPFQANEAVPAGASLCFRVGYDRQTLEFCGWQAINYGQDVLVEELPRTRLTYAGRQPDAGWREDAETRIEKHRKGDLLVRVVNHLGEPVQNATVEAVLRRHKFGFGTAVSARMINDPSSDGIRYRELLLSLFNRATFENDMKWPALYNGVPVETDRAVGFLREHGIAIRGHNLIWPSWRWMPSQLEPYRADLPELRRRAAAHVRSTVSHFEGQLIHWDVVNEPFSEHDLLDLLGAEVMVEWFQLARQADPAVKLYLNDYGIFDSGLAANAHADHFYRTLQFLRDRGAPLDGVGIQSHFAADLPPPEAMLKTLDRFSGFGLPIELTEVTVSLEDLSLQADYFRDYLTTVFSHPNVTGVLMWGFWSRGHWRPQSALFGDDWQDRPMGRVFKELVHGEWMTSATLTTDRNGTASIRGFLGRYDVSVRINGETYSTSAQLDQDGTEVCIKCVNRSDS